MKSEVIQKNGWTVLAVQGRIDTATSPGFEKAVAEQLATELSKLALDLSEVDYISSSGLRVLLSTLKKLHAGGGKLVLVNPQPYVMEVLDVSGFSGIFTIVDELPESI